VFFILSCTFWRPAPLPVAGQKLNKMRKLTRKKGDKMGDSDFQRVKNTVFKGKNEFPVFQFKKLFSVFLQRKGAVS
jgi:hypothetical protein